MSESNLRDFYSSYDWSGTDFSRYDDALAENVLARLGTFPGKAVLDLGCGSAALAAELAARGYEVTALDLTTEAARRRIATRRVSVTVVEQDMMAMTFRSAFGAVVNWDVSGLGLLPSDEAHVDVIRRVREALLPGGRFLVETYHDRYAHAHGVEGLVYDPSQGRFAGTVSRPSPDGQRRTWALSFRVFSLAEWQLIFHQGGLTFMNAWGSLSGDPLQDDCRMIVLLAQKPYGR